MIRHSNYKDWFPPLAVSETKTEDLKQLAKRIEEELLKRKE
jgi:hypothetical protein